MTTAREIMTADCTCVDERDTLAAAARTMRDLDVGALPICGEDDRLKGMLTDRDMVVRSVAQNGDPTRETAGSLAQGRPVYVDADADVEPVLDLMTRHQVRRLPVIENGRLVGIIAQADIARYMSEQQAARVVERVSTPA